MHKHRYRLAAAAALLLAGMSAQACEIWRDKELGVWRGNCDLSEYLVSQTFIAIYQRPPFIFKAPDLQIREFDYYVSGRNVEVYAEVENIGGGNAGASVVAVSVNIGDPATGNQMTTQQFSANVPALTRNSSRSVLVGTVTVPNNAQDWDVIVYGVTDPTTMASPVRGAIIESNETNNSLNHVCRWYGPNPDTSVAGCN